MPKKNTTKPNNLRAWVRQLTPVRATWIMICLGAALFLVTLIAAQLTRPYGSDDVANQVIFQSWTHGLRMNAVAGSDNWILKAPVYLLQDLLIPHNSRAKLFMTVLLFAAVAYTGIVVFTQTYIAERRMKQWLPVAAAFVPIVWYFGLTALPNPNATFVDISWVANFFKLNLRNAELGVALLLLLPWARFIAGDLSLSNRRHQLLALVLAVFTGIFLYSDPYFLFTLVGGTLLACFILWLTGRLSNRQLVVIGLYGLAAAATYEVLGKLLHHAHYYASGLGNFAFPPFSSLPQTFANTGEGIFKMFNADFWGFAVQSPHEKIFMLNAALVLIAAVACIYAVARLRAHFSVLRLLLVCIIACTLTVYAVSLNGTDPTQSRYLMLAVIASLPLAGELLADLSRLAQYRRLFLVTIAVCAIGIAANFGVNVRLIQGAIRRPQDAPNKINYQIIKAAESAGAYKGYADYWDSDINTYFSDRSVVFIPTICSNGTLSRYNWLYNLSDYDDIHAARTFFLTTHERLGNSNGYCGDLLQPFGLPVQTIDINSSYTMYIYNYDIGPKIAYASPSV